MKIDFCSDLHVDAWMHTTVLREPGRRMWAGEPFKSMFYYIDWRLYKNPDSRVLVIAGDIANNLKISETVVVAAAEEYEYVVVVEGNHDHYDNDLTVEEGMAQFAASLMKYSNVVYLTDETRFVLDDVAFLGATGWYDFKAFEDQGISDFAARRAWHQYSNDSRFPRFDALGPSGIANVQAINLAEQMRELSADDDITSVVLATHMSPRADLMEWKPGNVIWNTLTPSYVNTALQGVLDADDNHKIRYWIYGHTHTRQMRDIDGVIYANNARGYPRENPPFTLTQIEVPSK